MMATSLSPPRDTRTNFRPRHSAIVDAIEVLPTPGGPDSSSVFPLGDFLSLETAKNSRTLSLTYSNP